MSPLPTRPSHDSREEELSLFESTEATLSAFRSANGEGVQFSAAENDFKSAMNATEHGRMFHFGNVGSNVGGSPSMIKSGPFTTTPPPPPPPPRMDILQSSKVKLKFPSSSNSVTMEQQIIRNRLEQGVNQFIKQVDGGLQCTLCNRDFSWQNSLVRHITCVHAGVKNFRCKECGKCFKGRHGLKYHTEAQTCIKSRSHSKGNRSDKAQSRRPSSQVIGDFPCKICSKTFTQQKILTRHIKTVHDSVDAFKCPHCPKAFKSKQGLEYHTSRTHLDEPRWQPSGGLYANGASRVWGPNQILGDLIGNRPVGGTRTSVMKSDIKTNNTNYTASQNTTSNTIGQGIQHFSTTALMNHQHHMDQQRLRQESQNQNVSQPWQGSQNNIFQWASLLVAHRRNSLSERRNSISELLSLPFEPESGGSSLEPVSMIE